MTVPYPLEISSLTHASSSQLTDRFVVDQIINNSIQSCYVTTSQILANIPPAPSAPNYTLPIASTTILGGIKIGSNITVDQYGTISVTFPTPTSYSLPPASSVGLGGVIIGTGLAITSSGLLSSPIATQLTVGTVKTGTGGLTITSDGTLSIPLATSSIPGAIIVGNGLNVTSGVTSLNPATVSSLGGIIVGQGLSIGSDGTLTASAGGYSLPAASYSSLGGVSIGSGLFVDPFGVLSVLSSVSADPPTIATGSSLGEVIVGNGLSVASDGTISTIPATRTTLGTVVVSTGLNVDGSGNLTVAPATATTLGGIIPGNNCSVTAGVLNVVPGSYTLPTATSTLLGGIKPDGITLTNSSGVVTVTYGTTANTACVGNDSRFAAFAPLSNPTFTGTPHLTTAPGTTDNSLAIPSTSWVAAQNYITLASLPIGTTTTAGNVIIGNGLSVSSGIISVIYGTSSNQAVVGNDSRLTGAAPLASPTFTGVASVSGSPPSVGNTSNQIATAQFVTSSIQAITGLWTTSTPYPMGYWNIGPVVNSRPFQWISPNNCTLTSVLMQCLNVTGGNGFTITVTQNGTPISGLVAISISGTTNLYTYTASSPINVTAGDIIGFVTTLIGTWPTSGTGFVQLQGVYR
jgi:hypothetical protein